MKKSNDDIRFMLNQAGVRQWELAKAMGYSSHHFSVKMREELPEKDKLRAFLLIQQIADRKAVEE